MFGYGLDIGWVQRQFHRDLPIREVQSHQIQTNDLHRQRLMIAFEHGSGQVIELFPTGTAPITLARFLRIVAASLAHVISLAAGTSGAIWPTLLAYCLITFLIVNELLDRYHFAYPC